MEKQYFASWFSGVFFSKTFEENVTKIKLYLSTFFVKEEKDFLFASCPTSDPRHSPDKQGWPVTPASPVQLEQSSEQEVARAKTSACQSISTAVGSDLLSPYYRLGNFPTLMQIIR